MNKQPDNIDQLLPYGEMLRGYMEQSLISKNDLKNILRQRGVFILSAEKNDTIPVLASTILGPDEFDQLRECYKSKEDNPKRITQIVDWESEKTLIECVAGGQFLDPTKDFEFSNYTVNGSPMFVTVNGDPNHVRMEFDVERNDTSKNWAASKSVFPGSVELKRVTEHRSVKIAVTYTANETKDVAHKASGRVVRHFKDNGLLRHDKDVRRVLFSRFSNRNRIAFFLAMTTKSDSAILTFSDISDMGVAPDRDSGALPDRLNWLESQIHDLKLTGQALHHTLLVSDYNCHNHLHLYRLDAAFQFNLGGAVGECRVTIHFPEFERSRRADAELEINVAAISSESKSHSITRNDILKAVLNDLENQSIRRFDELTDR